MSDTEHEVRRNVVTGRNVIIAPNRGGRPRETRTRDTADAVSTCPFCPGHEDQLTAIIDERPAEDEKPWQTRVVPNKYAALVSSSSASTSEDALFRTAPAQGQQEIIIETPAHDRTLPDLSVAAIAAVVETYRQRCRAVREEQGLIPFIFRNYGGRAGASLTHPHSQLIATRFPPADIQREEQRARAYYDRTGQCLLCALWTRESEAGRRVVLDDDAFLAFVPFAAEVPFELWIVPKRHRAAFAGIAADEVAGLARVLRTALRRLREQGGNPDYNYNFYVRMPLRSASDAPHLHWYLRIVPRTKVRAGFELSTGVQINPSRPEADAETLRAG